ncbi:hypothetical protein C8R43DRAFT_661850 [Mycena crocata]|nr:hypothetical protein C8R43DRAFT_661850 [Mycena crocata]
MMKFRALISLPLSLWSNLFRLSAVKAAMIKKVLVWRIEMTSLWTRSNRIQSVNMVRRNPGGFRLMRTSLMPG